ARASPPGARPNLTNLPPWGMREQPRRSARRTGEHFQRTNQSRVRERGTLCFRITQVNGISARTAMCRARHMSTQRCRRIQTSDAGSRLGGGSGLGHPPHAGLTNLLLAKLFADLRHALEHRLLLLQVLLEQLGAFLLTHQLGLLDKALIQSDLVVLSLGRA